VQGEAAVKDFDELVQVQESGEAEELIGQALYLLQLCQQDINMGRTVTVWPRARRARQACKLLEDMFHPR
jgi:hypothetical protein